MFPTTFWLEAGKFMVHRLHVLHLGAGDSLYQLSIYAFAWPIPEPACCLPAPVQCSSERPDSVILRHVLLRRLAELLSTDRARGIASERMRSLKELIQEQFGDNVFGLMEVARALSGIYAPNGRRSADSRTYASQTAKLLIHLTSTSESSYLRLEP